MASDPTPPRRGMSLYANLLNPSTDTPGTISRAPVVFKQPETEPQPDDAAAKKQQLNPGIYHSLAGYSEQHILTFSFSS